jgi:hypothetical protein
MGITKESGVQTTIVVFLKITEGQRQIPLDALTK